MDQEAKQFLYAAGSVRFNPPIRFISSQGKMVIRFRSNEENSDLGFIGRYFTGRVIPIKAFLISMK